MVLERQARYRTFQTCPPTPPQHPFCLAAPTCPFAPTAPVVSPALATHFTTMHHPTRLFSGIRNAVDKILRAADM